MRMFGYAARVFLAAFVLLGLIIIPASAATNNYTGSFTFNAIIGQYTVAGNQVTFTWAPGPYYERIYVIEHCVDNRQYPGPSLNWNPSNNTSSLSDTFSYSCPQGVGGPTKNFTFTVDSSPNQNTGNPGQSLTEFPLLTAPPAAPPAPNVVAGNCLLSDSQYAMTARWAGFTGDNLVTSIAVMFAESSGRVNAIHLNTNQTYDIGLWQINDGAHPTYDRVLLGTNPAYNATAAFNIFTSAAVFSPWVTFTTQKYTKYLARAQAAVNETTASIGITDCSGGVANTRDLDGNGIPDTNPDGTPVADIESSCGFSLNPVKYFVCLFKPSSSSFSQWTDLQANAQSKPPLNVITAAYGYVNSISTTYNYCVNDPQQNCTATGPEQTINIGGLMGQSPTQHNDIAFPVLQKLSNTAQNSVWQTILGMLRYFMWGFFFWFVWIRISKSFGGKDTGNENNDY